MGDLVELFESGESPELVRSTSWMVGIFCDSCHQSWAERAPCPHCGEFSRPETRTFREVVRGNRYLPWTWQKGFEFADHRRKTAAPEKTQRAMAVR